jgi:hypothetical protein
MDSHAPVPRQAVDGNAARRKLARRASIAAFALVISKRLRRDAGQSRASSFQNLLHRAC